VDIDAAEVAQPSMPVTIPVVITTRGPNLGRVTMFEVFELIMTQPIIGRNARPELTGLKCLTSCR